MSSLCKNNDKRSPKLKASVIENILLISLNGVSIYEHEKINNGILIIGNESKGISKELLQSATQKITIPKKGEAESLNAAVATGIILSHLL